MGGSAISREQKLQIEREKVLIQREQLLFLQALVEERGESLRRVRQLVGGPLAQLDIHLPTYLANIHDNREESECVLAAAELCQKVVEISTGNLAFARRRELAKISRTANKFVTSIKSCQHLTCSFATINLGAKLQVATRNLLASLDNDERAYCEDVDDMFSSMSTIYSVKCARKAYRSEHELLCSECDPGLHSSHSEPPTLKVKRKTDCNNKSQEHITMMGDLNIKP